MTDKAVAWLRGRAEARLAAAKAAASVAGPDWHHDLHYASDGSATVMLLSARGSPLADMLHRDDEEIAPFLALNDPQDVIARCEAELAILDEHAQYMGAGVGGIPDFPMPWCRRCGHLDAAPVAFPCPTVRLLASAYRHQEGWAEHWGEKGGNGTAH